MRNYATEHSTPAFILHQGANEQKGLRHIPPGEFGKVIGLDRVPEVHTLSEKISTMTIRIVEAG